MPDFTFDSLDAIPEEYRSFASTKEDGKAVINLVPKAKIDEFRENNINLAKERDDLKAKIGGYSKIVGEDITSFEQELANLRGTAQKVKDGELKESTDIEAALADRTAQMRSSYEEQLIAARKEVGLAREQAQALDLRLKQTVVEKIITDAVLNEKSGALPEALPHILQEASKVFVVDDEGQVTPKHGDATIYGADGTSPMTALEWLGKLRDKSGYLFKQSSGGGAVGGKNAKIGDMSASEFSQLSGANKLKAIRRAGM